LIIFALLLLNLEIHNFVMLFYKNWLISNNNDPYDQNKKQKVLKNILNWYILISVGTTAENKPQVLVILNHDTQAESVSSVQLAY
jgi:hypothetical protein